MRPLSQTAGLSRQMNKQGETIIRAPGSMSGQPFVGDGLTDCTLSILDNCAQVQLDDLIRCTVTIGPCEDSIFIRNAVDCEIHAVGRQVRTRDCVNCKFYLHVLTDPVRPIANCQPALARPAAQ